MDEASLFAKALTVFDFLTHDSSVPVLIIYGPRGSGKKHALDMVKEWMERLIEYDDDPHVTNIRRIPRAYSIILQYQQRTEHFTHPALEKPGETLNRNCKTLIIMKRKPPQDMCCALRAETVEFTV